MPEVIETARLVLRPFTADDLQAAFKWFGDPEVMRFTPTGPDLSLDVTRRRLITYQEHQAIHGFSKWIARERDSVEPIGDAGLLLLEDSGNIDLGFRFAKPHWGKGLATEVAEAWIRAAFRDLGLDRLTAFAHPQNFAALRVLEKLGFRWSRTDRIMGMEAVTFFLHAFESHTRAVG